MTLEKAIKGKKLLLQICAYYKRRIFKENKYKKDRKA
jgi:hypothetical protein